METRTVHLRKGTVVKCKAAGKCDFSGICHQVLPFVIGPFNSDVFSVQFWMCDFHSFTFLSLLAGLCRTAFSPRPTAHVQSLENKTRPAEKVPLSHLVIHRLQACSTSNHTSAAAISAECFDSRVVGQQNTGQFHLFSKVLTQTQPD